MAKYLVLCACIAIFSSAISHCVSVLARTPDVISAQSNVSFAHAGAFFALFFFLRRRDAAIVEGFSLVVSSSSPI